MIAEIITKEQKFKYQSSSTVDSYKLFCDSSGDVYFTTNYCLVCLTDPGKSCTDKRIYSNILLMKLEPGFSIKLTQE